MRARPTTIIFSLAVALVLAHAGVATAAAVVFQVDEARIPAAGSVPYVDGEILVPASTVASVLDGVVSADPVLGTCLLKANQTEVTFFAGRNRALINGEEVFLEHAAQGSGSSMRIPVGFVAETVGAKLTREGFTRVKVERGRFAPRRSADDVSLSVIVEGVPHVPKVWRALPTFDKLDIAAAEIGGMLAGKVEWDPELRAATLTVDTHTVVFFQDKIHALVDGRSEGLSRVPRMSKQQLLLPVEDVCRLLNRSFSQKTMWSFAIGVAQ